jgi:hypothetical protein
MVGTQKVKASEPRLFVYHKRRHVLTTCKPDWRNNRKTIEEELRGISNLPRLIPVGTFSFGDSTNSGRSTGL